MRLIARGGKVTSAMQLDPALYVHHLAGIEMSDAPKIEVVQAVCLMMESFVDLAFGTDATQLSLGISDVGSGHAGADALDSADQLPSTCNDAAREHAVGKTTP